MEQTTGFGNNYDHQATVRFFRRWWKTLLIVFVAGAAVSLLVAVAIAIWAPVHGYLGVVIWGAAFAAVYAFFLWFFGMNRFERGLISNPVKKILRRFGR